MHYPEGDILGSDLTMRLREEGFDGFICIRSANDDATSEQLYLNAGADGLVSKGVKMAAAVQQIIALYQERPYLRHHAGVDIQSALRTVTMRFALTSDF